MLTKLYTVHLNPAHSHPFEKAVFVPDGFNFYAFIFGFLWALYHRIWIPALIFFCLTLGAVVAGQYVGLTLASAWVLQFGIRLMIGFAANDLWRETLEKRGYIISDVVIADSLLEANRRYFDRHLTPIEASMMPRTA